ncbi:hypothetical protein K466DRAFT_566775 [Polyporus arcularius HHB13444]|uniref:Uncharacterized protein n=1 Tax=Polyporus arcularius HHB13444 TaxID=1314778 RepID=A0A5C3PH09_9APHY|nr:hypothetical protein K466DRAFT_566775 [Polyporus arcularius HHB13444]
MSLLVVSAGVSLVHLAPTTDANFHPQDKVMNHARRRLALSWENIWRPGHSHPPRPPSSSTFLSASIMSDEEQIHEAHRDSFTIQQLKSFKLDALKAIIQAWIADPSRARSWNKTKCSEFIIREKITVDWWRVMEWVHNPDLKDPPRRPPSQDILGRHWALDRVMYTCVTGALCSPPETFTDGPARAKSTAAAGAMAEDDMDADGEWDEGDSGGEEVTGGQEAPEPTDIAPEGEEAHGDNNGQEELGDEDEVMDDQAQVAGAHVDHDDGHAHGGNQDSDGSASDHDCNPRDPSRGRDDQNDAAVPPGAVSSASPSAVARSPAARSLGEAREKRQSGETPARQLEERDNISEAQRSPQMDAVQPARQPAREQVHGVTDEAEPDDDLFAEGQRDGKDVEQAVLRQTLRALRACKFLDPNYEPDDDDSDSSVSSELSEQELASLTMEDGLTVYNRMKGRPRAPKVPVNERGWFKESWPGGKRLHGRGSVLAHGLDYRGVAPHAEAKAVSVILPDLWLQFVKRTRVFTARSHDIARALQQSPLLVEGNVYITVPLAVAGIRTSIDLAALDESGGIYINSVAFDVELQLADKYMNDLPMLQHTFFSLEFEIRGAFTSIPSKRTRTPSMDNLLPPVAPWARNGGVPWPAEAPGGPSVPSAWFGQPGPLYPSHYGPPSNQPPYPIPLAATHQPPADQLVPSALGEGVAAAQPAEAQPPPVTIASAPRPTHGERSPSRDPPRGGRRPSFAPPPVEPRAVEASSAPARQPLAKNGNLSGAQVVRHKATGDVAGQGVRQKVTSDVAGQVVRQKVTSDVAGTRPSRPAKVDARAPTPSNQAVKGARGLHAGASRGPVRREPSAGPSEQPWVRSNGEPPVRPASPSDFPPDHFTHSASEDDSDLLLTADNVKDRPQRVATRPSRRVVQSEEEYEEVSEEEVVQQRPKGKGKSVVKRPVATTPAPPPEPNDVLEGTDGEAAAVQAQAALAALTQDQVRLILLSYLKISPWESSPIVAHIRAAKDDSSDKGGREIGRLVEWCDIVNSIMVSRSPLGTHQRFKFSSIVVADYLGHKDDWVQNAGKAHKIIIEQDKYPAVKEWLKNNMHKVMGMTRFARDLGKLKAGLSLTR